MGLENATGLETVWGFYREMWGYYGAVVGLRNAGALPGGFYGAGEWRTLRALLWGGVCCGVRECSGAGNALGGCAEMWGGCGAGKCYGAAVDLIYAFVSFLDLVISAKIFLALESFKNVTRALCWPALDTVTSLGVSFVSLIPFKS